MKTRAILTVLIILIGVVPSVAQQQKTSPAVIFHETFDWKDTTAPLGWKLPDYCYLEDPLDNGLNWHWYPNDSLITNQIADPPFQSTSKGDGHLCLFGGLYNIDLESPDRRGIRNSIVFTGIDCSEYPTLILEFQTTFSNYTFHGFDYDHGGWDNFVEVSGDNGVHWALWEAGFEVRGGNPPYDVSQGEAILFRANLSGVGGGQSNVMIRFTWSNPFGKHYWIIDDLKLYEALPNDLHIDKVDVQWDDQIEGTEESISYMMPYSQLAPGHGFHIFKSYVTNMGGNEAENLRLEVSVKHEGITVFQESKTLPYVLPGFKDSLILDGRYEPTEKGEYSISYKWTHDQEDDYPLDNEETIYCYFSDSVYNRAGDQPDYLYSYNNSRYTRDGWDLHANLEHSMGSVFPIYEDCELDGISAYITGGLADGLIDFCYTVWKADYYILTGEIIDPIRIMFTEYLELDSSMFNTWVYLPYEKDGESEFIKAGSLLWTGVQYNNWHEDEMVRKYKGLSMGATNNLPWHDTRAMCSRPYDTPYRSGRSWAFAFDRNLMMRLYLHGTGSSAVPFISNGNSLTVFQNYPNPFSDQTSISFNLGKEASVQIRIMDILGKEVLTRDLGMIPAGEHTTTINNQDLSPGIYFYTLIAGDMSQTRKMIVK